MWSRTCLIGVLLLVAWPASAQVKLDGFLDGIIENSCEGSADFQAFQASIGQRYGWPPKPEVRAVIPLSLRPAVGKARAERDEGGAVVTVPLPSTFRGLLVSEVRFGFANMGGYQVTLIVFSSPLEEVRRVLGRTVEAGTRKLNSKYKDLDGEPQNDRLAIRLLEGRPTLICDRST